MVLKPASTGSSRENAIDLDEDDDPAAQPISGRATAYDLDDISDENDEIDDNDDLDMVPELSPGELRAFNEARSQRDVLPQGHRLVDFARSSNGTHVVPGSGVDLHDGSFLWVQYLIRVPSGDISMKGVLLKRNFEILYAISKTTGEDLHAILPKLKNELCAVLKVPLGKIGSLLDDECMVIRPLDAVVSKRTIIFTNFPHPTFNYQQHGMSVANDGRRHVEDHAVLCCRWKFAEEIHDTSKKIVAWQLMPLRQGECDKDKAVADVSQRRKYGKQKRSCQKTTTGVNATQSKQKAKPTLASNFVDLTMGSGPVKISKRKVESCEEEELTRGRNTVSLKRRSVSTIEEKSTYTLAYEQERYTLGDVCACAGGVSRGGTEAGLKLSWGLDNWKVAIESLRINFPHVPGDRFVHTNVEDFAAMPAEELESFIVDILHISFPCKGHSHRNRGQNPERDAANNVLVMALEQLLKKLLPRVVTLEQTNHMMTKNEGFFFRKVLYLLTSAGYGVRWKVCNMLENGVPQARHRLMIMAVCPGEKAPSWPPATHGCGPGFSDPVTIRQAIQDIPINATMHDIAEQQDRYSKKPRKLPVANLDRPLTNLIDTGGVHAVLNHPRGNYWPTIRQQLSLQTFPHYHQLAGSTQKDLTEQIGNAVPCVFMKQFFEQIIKTLVESDAETDAWDAGSGGIIEID